MPSTRSTIWLVVLALAGVSSLLGASPSSANDGTPVTQFFGCGGLIGSDDSYEQNDTQGTASTVSLPFDDADLINCSGDLDWFEFQVGKGADLQIDLTFSDASGDLDMRLYNEAGGLLTSSISTTDNESISYTVQSSGMFAVKVETYQAPLFYKGNDYRLQISVSCPDDAFEQDDTQQTATAIAVPFSETLRVCPGDDDWFEVPLTKGGEVQIDATFVNADGDVDLILLDSGGDTVANSVSTSDDESFTYVAAGTDVYVLRVHLFGLTPDEGNQYALEITTSCPDDPSEENDTQGGASPIVVPFADTDLRVCPGDGDWFSFALAEGEQVQITATFVDAKGNIDLVLHDPSGATVDTATSSSDNEELTYVAESAGFHAVEVVFDGSPPIEGNQYELTVSTEILPTATPTLTATPTVTATSPAPTATATATATSTPSAEAGDADCDGSVTALDALFVLQFVAGLIGDLPCPDAADANQDGDVTAIDSALILQAAAFLVTL